MSENSIEAFFRKWQSLVEKEHRKFEKQQQGLYPIVEYPYPSPQTFEMTYSFNYGKLKDLAVDVEKQEPLQYYIEGLGFVTAEDFARENEELVKELRSPEFAERTNEELAAFARVALVGEDELNDALTRLSQLVSESNILSVLGSELVVGLLRKAIHVVDNDGVDEDNDGVPESPRLGDLNPEALAALQLDGTDSPTVSDISAWGMYTTIPKNYEPGQYGIPRKSTLEGRTKIEQEIFSCVGIIETGPADVRLSLAQSKLLEALDLMAEVIDNEPVTEAGVMNQVEDLIAAPINDAAVDELTGLVIGQVPAVTRYVEERVPQEPPLSEKVDYDEAAKIAKTDKRVTPEIIDRTIAKATYFHLAGTTTTICALTLAGEGRDGWTVVGTSGCYDPRNYNPMYGRKAAYENARRKIFDLVAFVEHTKLVGAQVSPDSETITQ